MTSHICLLCIPFRIPPELILMIIDNLEDDKKAISACSLVSRDWLDIARTALFRKLRFNAEAIAFDEKLISFIQFFGSTLHTARYVDSLSITTPATEERNFKPGRFTTAHLKAIVPIFPNLRALSLTRIDWRATEPHQMDKIQTLRLTTVSSQDCEHWLNLVWTFPNLRQLIIDRFFIPMMSVPRHDAPTPQIRDSTLDNLQVLDIQYTPLASSILTALRRVSELKTLRTFSVCLMHGADISCVAQVLHAAHSVLTNLHLSLTIAGGQRIPDVCERMNDLPFHSLTYLRTLAFSLTYSSPGWVWDCIVTMISRTSASLQSVHFTFLFRYYNAVPWHELDQVLISLPSLKRVEFVNHRQAGEAAPRDFPLLVELGLPLTYEKGLLFCPQLS